jgi:signal transduction histidine kinase/DNA-binding response OmpR family regulator
MRKRSFLSISHFSLNARYIQTIQPSSPFLIVLLNLQYDCDGQDKNVCLQKKIFGVRKDKSRFDVEVSLTNVHNEGEIYTLILVRDITERTKIDKLKNEFVSTVSHELRTPLTSIRGALGLVLSGKMGSLSDKISGLLNIANTNCLRLINLINDILDIEKIEAGKMTFNCSDEELIAVVKEAIAQNGQFAKKYEVSIEFESKIEQAKVKIDKERIIQVVTNLLSNAIKFSKAQSNVTVCVERLDNLAKVSVTNYGTEISEEFKNRIFQKFAQADSSDSRKKGGTGLGLSISKAIVEHLNGEIGFVSQNNQTTFYFTLPEIKNAKLVENSNHDNNKTRILICENDVDIANLLNIILQQEDYISDIAYSAGQAKELLKANSYDAMTLDLLLPDMDGLSLLQEIRKSPKIQKLPIIVVSVIAKEKRKEFDGKFTVMDWIDKPIQKDKLIEAINRAIKIHEKPNILHVEDDEGIRLITETILEKDANIYQASSLSEAKGILENNNFDLLLLDLDLPDGNGADLIPLVKSEQEQNVATVIFSAYAVDRDLAKKVDAVLMKSNTSNKDLLKIIELIKTRKNK